MKNELVTLDFHGQAIAAYLIDGHRHALTDEQAGTLLGYAHPVEAIIKLVERDTHSELEGLSTSVKLTGVEGERTVTRTRRVWGREGVIALAMLSSTEVGAKVRVWARKALLDKVDEARAAGVLPSEFDPGRRYSMANRIFGSALKIAKGLGLDGNQQKLKAMEITRRETGLDVAELFGIKALANSTGMRHLSVTEIGQQLSPAKSGRETNLLLAGLGFQRKEDKNWVGSPDHSEYWEMADVSKAHADGTTQQLRWYPSVIPVLQRAIDASDAV